MLHDYLVPDVQAIELLLSLPASMETHRPLGSLQDQGPRRLVQDLDRPREQFHAGLRDGLHFRSRNLFLRRLGLGGRFFLGAPTRNDREGKHRRYEQENPFLHRIPQVEIEKGREIVSPCPWRPRPCGAGRSFRCYRVCYFFTGGAVGAGAGAISFFISSFFSSSFASAAFAFFAFFAAAAFFEAFFSTFFASVADFSALVADFSAETADFSALVADFSAAGAAFAALSAATAKPDTVRAKTVANSTESSFFIFFPPGEIWNMKIVFQGLCQ